MLLNIVLKYVKHKIVTTSNMSSKILHSYSVE